MKERHRLLSTSLTVLVLLTGARLVLAQGDLATRTSGTQTCAAATPLRFHEFFEPSKAELKLSAKLLSLNGKRVRMVGFMAQMEQPLPDSFYLTPRPVFCDEEGGGNADLPPESVLIVVRSAGGREIAFIPGALEVTGTLEIGSRTEADGRVSFIRLILDANDQAKPQSATWGATTNK